MSAQDPLPLARTLIRAPSVTPADAGAQDALAITLRALGFRVVSLPFGPVQNLFAKIGEGAPHFCFAGHTDVVPAEGLGWSVDPFAAEVKEGVLYGRGASDMKGAIAAFVAGAAMYLEGVRLKGSISLLITGDEEGRAEDGTAKVLAWMAAHGEKPDFCLVGEPTNATRLGETIKIGRRGSLNAAISIAGTAGHVAYPARADNPIHRLVGALAELLAAPLDAGSRWFEPSGLEITSVDVGNPASNVIPAAARAALNIRFNDLHRGEDLARWLREVVTRHAPRSEVEVAISGEAFLTKPGPEVERLQRAIAEASGVTPKLETGGGTSDARFIAGTCPVAEFGLVGASMHKVDECVPLADLTDLARIYRAILAAFLG